MQRDLQNIRVSARTTISFVILIKSLVYLVTSSMKIINVMHSTVPYLVNFASGPAQVLIIYTYWKRAQFIFAGGCFGIMFCDCGPTGKRPR